MAHFLRHGTICSIRREIGDWRVIDERFDGHVHQYLMQSLNNGAIAWRFLHEITEKDSSTYQEINDFLNSVANDFDEDLFEFVQPSTMKHENNCNTEDVHVNCHENRFKPVTTSSLESLKDCNTEVTTKKQTKWAVKMLKDYMMEARYTTTDFEMLSVEDLDQLLEQFYAALQSKTGKDYSKQTLVAIRAGLNRHLTSLPFSRKLSLMRDRDFAESNKVLSGKIKTPVPSLKPPVLTQQSDNAQFSTTCSTQSMSVSKSVDVRQSGNISAFHMFSGNVSSSTINVYCTANPFENRN